MALMPDEVDPRLALEICKYPDAAVAHVAARVAQAAYHLMLAQYARSSSSKDQPFDSWIREQGSKMPSRIQMSNMTLAETELMRTQPCQVLMMEMYMILLEKHFCE